MIDSRTFYNFADVPLYIGYHGENLVTGVNIDLSGVLPDGWGAALLLRRSGESTVYPATSTLDGKILRVVYSVADSAIEGRGEATIQLMGGNGEIMKSQTALTIVTHALNIGEPPDPVAHWLYEMEHRLIPPGGTDGQVLTKNGAADYNAAWEDPQGGGEKPYLSLERVSRYLYNVSFKDAPDVNADYVPAGGCSAYVQDGKLYRNLDWSYDNEATFHVRLPGIDGLAFAEGLTDTELPDALIAQLPYRIVDGVNEHGIMISTHVLYNDWTWSGTGNIPLTRLPYLVLSRVRSMATIETDFAGVLDDLKSTPALDELEYLLQVLVTDGETSCVLAPATDGSNVYEIIDITENAKLANFRWVPDTTVVRTDLQRRPTGVERWNMMPCDLADLRFTKAYETPDRLSEFIGLRGTTKDSTDEELTEIYNEAHAIYLNRQRDGSTWQTMHSAVYSPKGLEHLWVQEDWAKDYIASSGGEDEIVYLEYGVSTYAEALAAYNAGKTLLLKYNMDGYGSVYVHLKGRPAYNFIFASTIFTNSVGNFIYASLNVTEGWGDSISIGEVDADLIPYDSENEYDDGTVGAALQGVQEVIPPDATTSNKLATADDIPTFTQAQMNAINSGATAEKIAEIDDKAEIDDTAGDGDTDKTWSADKLTGEFDGKADKPIIKTTMDSVAVAGAQYYLGEQSEVSIVLPSDASVGDQITAVWYNGATAATFSITGTMLDVDYTPSASSRSEINALWDGTYWAVVTNEQAVPEEAEAE